MHGDVLDIQGVRLSGGLAAVTEGLDTPGLLGGGVIGSKYVMACLVLALLALLFYRGV